MPPEVLIYIQNLKNFIYKNKNASEYFSYIGKEDEFFSKVTEYSTENFEKNGHPELTTEQFEEIRMLLNDNNLTIETTFIGLDGLPLISLN